jgi:hypothetical protein
MYLHALDNYQPFVILLLGILGWLSALGLGVTLLGMIRINLPVPWKQVVGLILGLLILSLVVQFIAMAGYSTQNNLKIIAVIFFSVSMFGIIRNPFRLFPTQIGTLGRFDFVLVGFICVSLLTNLLVAFAPSP